MSSATPSIAANQTSCQLVEVASLDMRAISGDRFTVPMTVGGKSVDMLLDTGDDMSTLTYQTAKDLDLRVKPLDVAAYSTPVTPEGLNVTDWTTAKDIQLGNLKGDRQTMGLWPGNTTEFGGSLGTDIVAKYDADFDFGNAKLNLFTRDHCPAPIYWTKGPVAVIPIEYTSAWLLSVELDGKKIDAVIDTSRSHSYLDWGYSQMVFDLNEKTQGLKAVRGKGDRTIYKYPFKSLNFNGIIVNNPDIDLTPSTVSNLTGNFPYLAIGMDVLKQLHIFVAGGEKKIYITSASAH
jgi:hypothetical protein